MNVVKSTVGSRRKTTANDFQISNYQDFIISLSFCSFQVVFLLNIHLSYVIDSY